MGRYRALHWRSTKENEFVPNHIITFAENNDWTFKERKIIHKENLEHWIDNNQMVFPVDYEGIYLGSDGPTLGSFPRWINEDIELLTFKTPWIVVDPGTAESYDAYGYVIINAKGNTMSVYHQWGE
jgi:hypothetical protein